MIEDDKISISMRIPTRLHNKIMEIVKKGDNITKTDVVVDNLNRYFELENSSKEEILKSIEDVFSIENKTFMPKNIYKKLLAKSEYEIREETKKGLIETTMIKGELFVMIDTELDQNAITVELLLQKKQLELLERKVERLSSIISQQ